MPEYISAKTLKEWIDQGKSLKIIDVRDSDRIGGHLRNSINFPSHRFSSSIADLEKTVAGSEKVVFYCQLSQQRGPSCAALYEKSAPSTQTVHVLEEGFQNWAHTYGKDATVTENFRPEFYP